MLIFRGGKTYPSIEEGNEKFVKALRPFMPAADYRVLPRKKHVPMILQFFNSSNPRYADIIRFMQTRLLPGVIF